MSRTHNAPATDPQALDLLTPPSDALSVAIVGGGPAGLMVADKLCEMKSGTRPTGRFDDLTSVCLFQGGDSMAFLPPSGQYGKFLKTICAQELRSNFLGGLSRGVRERFEKTSDFQFKENTRIDRILYDKKRDVYTLHFSDNCLDAKRVVLAMGHSLKERSPEISRHVFPGAMGLAQQLAQFSAPTGHEALSAMLNQFRPVDGKIVIGLIGVGATTVEVLRILHEHLLHPQRRGDFYRTSTHHTPIEVVIYDPKITPGENLFPQVCELIRSHCSASRLFGSSGRLGENNPTIASAIEELSRIYESQQLRIAPGKVIWDTVRVVDDLLYIRTNCIDEHPISCAIDCAPFARTLSNEHHAVIKGLASGGLKLWRDKATPDDHGWRASPNPSFSSRLAAVGAAFTYDATRWNMSQWETQADEVIDSFFPLRGLPPYGW